MERQIFREGLLCFTTHQRPQTAGVKGREMTWHDGLIHKSTNVVKKN